MKTFSVVHAHDLQHAAALAQEAVRKGQTASFMGGGSDLLALVKDRVVKPDVIVNLGSIGQLNEVVTDASGVTIGGLTVLDAVSTHARIRKEYSVLAEAAAVVATPQVRNVGTLAGNICQRPWCWYYRNGFPCFKAGGSVCYSAAGENQFHAIFGGGPSFIVHPSDTSPALVALGASFRLVGPSGQRTVSASDFFILPSANARKENVLADDEVLASVHLPFTGRGIRSTYFKVMDREAWTHAVVSVAMVLDMDGDTCRFARIVLGGVAPIPWRVPEAEGLLAGQRVTADLAAKVGEAAVVGARPLGRNRYKVPLTRNAVQRTLSTLATPR